MPLGQMYAGYAPLLKRQHVPIQAEEIGTSAFVLYASQMRDGRLLRIETNMVTMDSLPWRPCKTRTQPRNNLHHHAFRPRKVG